jgi:hypothetical protein
MENLEWRLQGTLATLESGLGIASLDLANPLAGLTLRATQFHVEPLFAFLILEQPQDVIARGRDLVLRFPPRAGDLVSYEVRYQVSEAADAMDMILSAQTQRLASKPETEVRSSFGAAELVKPRFDEPGLISPNEVPYCVARPTSADISLLMMVHPSDFYESTVDESSVTFRIFPESLEKGVIRRARLRLRLLDRSRDEAEAWEEFSRSRSEVPPLTT